MNDFEVPGEAYFVKVHPDAIAPVYKSRLAACADIAVYKEIVLQPREFDMIPTGLIVIPPTGWHFQVYLRSGIPFKFPGLILANCVGIIDSDYIGPKDELKLILSNQAINIPGKIIGNDIVIPAGTRIAQMRLVRNARPSSFKELSHKQVEARRNRGGFGSTG